MHPSSICPPPLPSSGHGADSSVHKFLINVLRNHWEWNPALNYIRKGEVFFSEGHFGLTDRAA